ncbi:hypothetical protein ACFVTE_21400 [Arthrobacter sp. NPDC058097]|uniref:hypothetical protein n=1 Tax=Arthrobacter sp. NPDC058097 TaxID=3346340 RepID=UPI0036D923E3
MQLAFQSYWLGGGLAGVLLASLLPGQIGGLEFALCALFVTLTLDAARWQKHISSVILAGHSFALAVLAVPAVFIITFGLRALPFAALKTLRESRLVKVLAWWMPAGIVGILAASTLRSTIAADPTPSSTISMAAGTCTLTKRRLLVSATI